MKKTFKLAPVLGSRGKNTDRLLDAIKHEVRKYVRRERQKPLPNGVDFWDFDCRFGLNEAEASTVHLNELSQRMGETVSAHSEQFYVEILAKAGVRKLRESTPSDENPLS